MKFELQKNQTVDGYFVDLLGERYYKIANVDNIAPFFISVVSSSDHWLFISSTGSLSSGRVRPENALFPYKSVDLIHESSENTGSKNIIRMRQDDDWIIWEPYNRHHDGFYQLERNLYKNTVGDKIVFEEINYSLQLRFHYSWSISEEFGFIRRAEVTNLSDTACELEILDGLQNILPSGAPLSALQTSSTLVDAYKWNEQIKGSTLALYTMYAKLSDRAEPAESLLATTVFNIDGDQPTILLSSVQLNAFRRGEAIEGEALTRGVRGSYLIHKTIGLDPKASNAWSIVADIDKDHSAVRRLQQQLLAPKALELQVQASIEKNQKELIALMAGADAWQLTAEESTYVHHYANVLFNGMRGGVIENNYQLDKQDVISTMTSTNRVLVAKHEVFFASLNEPFNHSELSVRAKQTGDQQLVRLSYEYLPLTFGRRHGDPSRPWNHYEIKLKDDNGERLLFYQGNWRDIFQNWEALSLSYPEFITAFMAKFVNASTVEGYNPYRITKQGIDWELLEPDDPWSNIGYWGDHQVIYLLKFLELAKQYCGDELSELMCSEVFSYANVPYDLCGVDALFANPKDTVKFNHARQQLVEQKVALLGSDGRLILDQDNQVYQVNLTEKVLVPLLSKLSNLVIDGGIWLNTQRPEWNDANNAIVGNGLSMVTLYYMRRYVHFLEELAPQLPETVFMSQQVMDWMLGISRILAEAQACIKANDVTPEQSKKILVALETCAQDYRESVYQLGGFSGKAKVERHEIMQLLTVSLSVLDSSIKHNLREDGLYNAYNILSYSDRALDVAPLYPMLEGQVAILSSGVLRPDEAVDLLENLFASPMYREDQRSFMLYPDRDLPLFIERNCIDSEALDKAPVLYKMLEKQDKRIIQQDILGDYHFNGTFENVGHLRTAIQQVALDYPEASGQTWQALEEIYEEVFHHRSFTGRSGTMFGYEGLGCIYWHMVSKLLLAVQENYQESFKQDPKGEVTRQLGAFYYRVREGIGFNKSPENYGAFPTDPYSHTPKQAGAQQPGMTGQVKEEILTRFKELGINVIEGKIHIQPDLLRAQEFLKAQALFRYLDISGKPHEHHLAEGELAFTYCQVPFVYQKVSGLKSQIRVIMKQGDEQIIEGLVLGKSLSESIFTRTDELLKVIVSVPETALYPS